MKPLLAKIPLLLLAALLPLLLLSCGGSGGSDTAGIMTGTLELGLTDAATDSYQAVYVTIGEVQVKKQGEGDGEAGWETIMTPEKTYDLLELRNGVIAALGVGELEAGQYGQMRLILGELPEGQDNNILDDPHPYANYVIDGEGNSFELKVPSGSQTGIKIVKGFTIAASQPTELVLDFDAARSVVQAGKSGKWLLKPTIKVLETVDNSVSGLVSDETGPIEGATVSAQIYTPQIEAPDGLDPRDEVLVEATTVSTETGAYKLYLPPDLYNIVVTMDGYLPACEEVAAQYYEELAGVDFSLIPETAPPVTIKVSVAGLDNAEETTVLLSIRQTMECIPEVDTIVEVASMMVAEDGEYSFTLPAGTYDLVASTAGKTTQKVQNITPDVEVNITF